MTSWKCKAELLLLVFMCTIDWSHGACHDYFKVDKWGQNLTETLPLVKRANLKDTMECSLERAVISQNTTLWYILTHCFEKTVKPQNISEKCQGDTSETVPFYHFMCLTAEAFNYDKADEEKIRIEGCKYDTVCRLFSEPLTGSTTVLPPTTITTALPLKVTSAPTPTTKPPTTTTPPTTTPTTTAPPPTTATTAPPPPPTTNFSQSNAQVKKQVIANEKVATENLALKIFSVISASFNMVLFMVALYRRKRNQRRQDCDKSITTHASDEASLEARPVTELKSCTELVSVNEDIEVTKHLMQSPEPDSISTKSELRLNED